MSCHGDATLRVAGSAAESPSADLTVNEQGRVTIPAQIRRAVGIEAGVPLAVYVEDGRVVLETRDQLAERVRRDVAATWTGDGSVVDELIAERRTRPPARTSSDGGCSTFPRSWLGCATSPAPMSCTGSWRPRSCPRRTGRDLAKAGPTRRGRQPVHRPAARSRAARRTVSEADAVTAARLWSPTRAAGLSVSDRCSLALGARLGLTSVIADAAWAGLHLDDITVQVLR